MARVLKTKIASLRKKAGLTRRALGARIATSPEQIERWEKGEEVAPRIAAIVAAALDAPLAAVFPCLADGEPADEKGWRQLGFDLEAPLFTWELEIVLRGVERSFHYLVDRKDADRISRILGLECDYDFIAFDSIGRSIHVSAKDIQFVRVMHEVTTLIPGVNYNTAQLHPDHAGLHLYFRGQAAPLTIDAFELDEDDLQAFAALDCASETQNDFTAINDEDGDVVCIRLSELVLAEVPHHELLEEMDAITDEEFWAAETMG